MLSLAGFVTGLLAARQLATFSCNTHYHPYLTTPPLPRIILQIIIIEEYERAYYLKTQAERKQRAMKGKKVLKQRGREKVYKLYAVIVGGGGLPYVL